MKTVKDIANRIIKEKPDTVVLIFDKGENFESQVISRMCPNEVIRILEEIAKDMRENTDELPF